MVREGKCSVGIAAIYTRFLLNNTSHDILMMAAYGELRLIMGRCLTGPYS